MHALNGQIVCLSDISDQRLICICLVDCESDHECQINFVYGLT